MPNKKNFYPNQHDDRTNISSTIEYYLHLPDSFGTMPPPVGQLIADAFILCQDYIWHNEAFNLTEKLLPKHHYYGSTNTNGNVDDEWFIIWLLIQLSIKHPSLVIRVRNHDGDPILNQSADILPSWLADDNCNKNRTFIHAGRVHLIPQRSINESAGAAVTVQIDTMRQGVDIILANSDLTQAPHKIDDLIRDRACLAKIPSHHNVTLLLPVPVAHVLTTLPCTLPMALTALSRRAHDSQKVIKHMPTFSSSETLQTHNDLVPVRVKLTKAQYAILALQSGIKRPDKGAWPKLPGAQAKDETLARRNELGFRLTCGYEIFCQQLTSNESFERTDSLSRVPKFIDNKNQKAFMKRLQMNGYFRQQSANTFSDVLLGTKEYANLENAARQFLERSAIRNQKKYTFKWLCALRCETLARQLIQDREQFALTQQSFINKAESNPPDDSVEWLRIVQTHSAFDEESDNHRLQQILIDERLMNAPPPPPVPSAQSMAAQTQISKSKRKQTIKDDIDALDDDIGQSSTCGILDFDHMHDNARHYQSSDTESYGDETLNIDLDEISLKEMSGYRRAIKNQNEIKAIDDDAEHSVIRHSSIISHPLKIIPKAPNIDASPTDVIVTTPLTAHKASPFRSSVNKITRPPALNKNIPIIGDRSDSEDESPRRPPRNTRRTKVKSQINKVLGVDSHNRFDSSIERECDDFQPVHIQKSSLEKAMVIGKRKSQEMRKETDASKYNGF